MLIMIILSERMHDKEETRATAPNMSTQKLTKHSNNIL